MGRPVKDYWNWTEIVVPYVKDSWQSPTGNIAAKRFLETNLGYNGPFEIRQSTEYPKPRKRYSTKMVSAHHYYIKDPVIATMFALKFS